MRFAEIVSVTGEPNLEALLDIPFSFDREDVLVAESIGSSYRDGLPGGSRWSADYSPESRIFLSYCFHTLPESLSTTRVKTRLLEVLTAQEQVLKRSPPPNRLPDEERSLELDRLSADCDKSMDRLKKESPAIAGFFRQQMNYFLELHVGLEDKRALNSIHAFSCACASIVQYLERNDGE